MGFGFVVARFGVFLQQLRLMDRAAAEVSYGGALWFGTALIAAGIFINLSSAWNHARLMRELAREQPPIARPSTQGIALAVFLALVGLIMAIYLVSVSGSPHSHSENAGEALMPVTVDNGIVNEPTSHSVDQTVERLKAGLQAKAVTLFALVDHSGEAAKVGMKMRPTKLLIFGNPKAGTPLMLAAPSSAIDLPLKMLVWEDDQGKVWISYNSSQYLQKRHGLPHELLANIAVVEALAAKAAE